MLVGARRAGAGAGAEEFTRVSPWADSLEYPARAAGGGAAAAAARFQLSINDVCWMR